MWTWLSAGGVTPELYDRLDDEPENNRKAILPEGHEPRIALRHDTIYHREHLEVPWPAAPSMPMSRLGMVGPIGRYG